MTARRNRARNLIARLIGVRAFAILNVRLAACWLVLVYRSGRMYDALVAEHAEPAADPERMAA